MNNTLKEIWKELERLENKINFSTFETYVEAVSLPPKTPMFTLDSIEYMIDYNYDTEDYEMVYWLETDNDNHYGRDMNEKDLDELLTKLRAIK